MKEINYKVLVFVQDNCIHSKQIKQELGLTTLSKTTIQNVEVVKQYPTDINKLQYDLKRIPTIVIISNHNQRPKQTLTEIVVQGVVSKINLVAMLENLKKGLTLTSPIK